MNDQAIDQDIPTDAPADVIDAVEVPVPTAPEPEPEVGEVPEAGIGLVTEPSQVVVAEPEAVTLVPHPLNLEQFIRHELANTDESRINFVAMRNDAGDVILFREPTTQVSTFMTFNVIGDHVPNATFIQA